jgi:hypothetical protein
MLAALPQQVSGLAAADVATKSDHFYCRLRDVAPVCPTWREYKIQRQNSRGKCVPHGPPCLSRTGCEVCAGKNRHVKEERA